MTGPAWLAPLLAAVMLLIAAGSVARLGLWWLRGRAAEPEADALHAVMGVAMAGMLESAIRPVPATAWLAVFTAAGIWFTARAIRARTQSSEPRSWRCAHPAPHTVECAAMIYMLVPATGRGHGHVMAMAAMTSAAPTANPALALLLALFMLGYIMWTADRLTGQYRPRSVTIGGEALAPRAAAWSRIAMSLAMGYMLLTML
jgi:Domain of unknown function (DUF5134)